MANATSPVAGPMAALGRDGSLVETVRRHAAERAERPFLVVEANGATHCTTYGDLWRQAAGWCSWLAGQGVAAGDTVALMFTTHPAQAPAFVGAMILGAIPFMLPTITARQDPALFWQSQYAVLERTAARLILTDAATALLMAGQGGAAAARVVDVDAVMLEHAEPPPPAPAGRGCVAFLQHSSGTTGAKKGVMLTHGMVLDFTAALGGALAVTEADIVASWLPLYHDMGLVGCFILPMLLGITAVHMSPFDWVARPASLLEMIGRHRATLCWQPNFAFQHIVRTAPRQGRWDLSSMRAFIDCSESCKPETVALFRERFGLPPHAVQASYGMAENVFIATQSDPRLAPRVVHAEPSAFDGGRIAPPAAGTGLAFLSTGGPIPGTRIEIRGEAGEALPERRVGQIMVASPYLFTGYFRSELAAEKLRDGWYATGDYGFLDGGELFVCGRRDELLIVNGRNLYAPDIEFAVNRATAVKPGRCVAIGPYNARTGSQSLVVIAETETEPATGTAELEAELKAAIQAVIQSQFGIATNDVAVVAPGWLLKTTSGKIARGANEAKYAEARARAAGAVG